MSNKSALGAFSPYNPDYGKNAALLAFAATMLQNAGRQPFGRGAPMTTAQGVGSAALAGLGAYGQAEQQQYARTKPNYQVINDKLVSITPSSERGGTPTIKEIADYGTPTAVKPQFKEKTIDGETQQMVSYDNGVTWVKWGESVSPDEDIKVVKRGEFDVTLVKRNGKWEEDSKVRSVSDPSDLEEAYETREELVKGLMFRKNSDGTSMSDIDVQLAQQRLEDTNDFINKKTTIIGKTAFDIKSEAEDAANKDLAKKHKETISTFEQAGVEIKELIGLVEKNPTSVGAVGAIKEWGAGGLGQLADLFGKEQWGDAVYESWDVSDTKKIRTKAKYLVGNLLPIITNENNKFTKEERELATEASGVLDGATDSRQTLDALGTTLNIVNNRLQRAKNEYGEIVEKEKAVGRSPISDLPSIRAITPKKALSMTKWLNDPNNKNNKHYERVKKDLADYYMNY